MVTSDHATGLEKTLLELERGWLGKSLFCLVKGTWNGTNGIMTKYMKLN